MIVALGSRFDWYELTMDDADADLVASKLAVAVGGQLVRGKGRNGYALALEVTRGDDVLGIVYGQSARPREVHVAVTGESCDDMVPLLRRFWPEHRVSRCDVSVDLAADFELVDAHALAFAEARGLKFELVTNSDGGATRYLGSRKSEVFVRVYKKSEQLMQLHPEKAAEVPQGVVRYEVEVKPGKREVKAAVARMDANDVWGLSQWGLDFAREALGIEAERVSTHFRRPSSWSRALHFLGEQYRPGIERRIEAVGIEQARAEVMEALGLAVPAPA